MAKQTVVELQKVEKRTIMVKLIGDSPLITHRFSAKAQGQMLAKQVKKNWPKEAKNPAECFEAATYYIDENGEELRNPANLELITAGRIAEFLREDREFITTLAGMPTKHFGFPAVGLKASAIRGAKSLSMTMSDMRGAFHIEPTFVEIHGDRIMRSDMVRIKMSSDVRFRPEFRNWWMEFPVLFNERAATPDQILNMFHAGGFACGIGEWRPEKGGDYGRFHVANLAE